MQVYFFDKKVDTFNFNLNNADKLSEFYISDNSQSFIKKILDKTTINTNIALKLIVKFEDRSLANQEIASLIYFLSNNNITIYSLTFIDGFPFCDTEYLQLLIEFIANQSTHLTALELSIAGNTYTIEQKFFNILLSSINLQTIKFSFDQSLEYANNNKYYIFANLFDAKNLTTYIEKIILTFNGSLEQNLSAIENLITKNEFSIKVELYQFHKKYDSNISTITMQNYNYEKQSKRIKCCNF